MDAIVSPGKVSAHTHYFLGASNPSPNSDFASLRNASCSTVGLGRADMSSYWMPAMYHRSASGDYQLLKGRGNKIYYNWKSDGSDQPFPDDFRMIVGNPMANRTCQYNGPTAAECPRFPTYYYCLGEPQSRTLPRECPSEVMGVHITFPSCWSGQPFNLTTQDDHLVFGTGGASNITCPDGFVNIPQIMYSWQVDLSGLRLRGDEDTLTLAMGTDLGAGVHADFINGWDREVLQDVINQCHNTTDNSVSECPALAQYMDSAGADACQFEGSLPAEDVGVAGPIPNLLVGSNSSCIPSMMSPSGYTYSPNSLPIAANRACDAAAEEPTEDYPLEWTEVASQSQMTVLERTILAAADSWSRKRFARAY